MKRTPLRKGTSKLNRGSKGLKRSGSLSKGSKRMKSRPKTKEEMLENQEDIKRMWEFYEFLWNKQPLPRECQVCDTPIYGSNSSAYHDHLLEKSQFPQYRYEESNMIFVCLDCHTAKNNGFPLPKHREAINKAKVKFNIL